MPLVGAAAELRPHGHRGFGAGMSAGKRGNRKHLQPRTEPPLAVLGALGYLESRWLTP